MQALTTELDDSPDLADEEVTKVSDEQDGADGGLSPDADESDGANQNRGAGVAIDDLEAEELEVIDKIESATMLVDETQEIREIRRSEMNLGGASEDMRTDEFVCRSCFLLLKKVQLADAAHGICRDCS